MYGELYQYLVFHKRLDLPGFGTFQLERKPAEFDHAARIVHPAAYSIVLHHSNATPSQKFFHWLAVTLQSTETDAIARFNDFISAARKEVMAGNKIDWELVGTISKGLAGEIRFDSALKDFTTDQPVPAIKIIREKAEHLIRVGEDEKTSAQMIELLNPVRQRRPSWWVAALIAAIVALLFGIIYFSQKGMTASSAGNQQQITPGKQTGTYNVQP